MVASVHSRLLVLLNNRLLFLRREVLELEELLKFVKGLSKVSEVLSHE